MGALKREVHFAAGGGEGKGIHIAGLSATGSSIWGARIARLEVSDRRKAC